MGVIKMAELVSKYENIVRKRKGVFCHYRLDLE